MDITTQMAFLSCGPNNELTTPFHHDASILESLAIKEMRRNQKAKELPVLSLLNTGCRDPRKQEDWYYGTAIIFNKEVQTSKPKKNSEKSQNSKKSKK